MKIELPYGAGTHSLDIPDKIFAGILEPAGIDGPERDARSVIREAADRPVDSASLDEFLSLPGGLLVIVNDGTRPTPTADVIDVLADRLEAAGAEFLVAAGAHRAPTPRELEYIFGENLERFIGRIYSHDADDPETDYYGTTSRGTEVRLNRRIKAAGRILVIGSVEPHYFAGFTGGRKGILPGAAAYTTIEQNHRLAMSAEAAPLRLEGNPVHEDLAEAVRFVDREIFSIMTVLDRNQGIFAAFAGGLEEAFRSAAETAAGVFAAAFSEPADVVIACAKYPMDIDLYQSQKALEHARAALKPGGTLILVSSCRDGIGDSTFSRLLSSCADPEEVYEKIRKGYRLGYHKSARLADLLKTTRVRAFTELAPAVLRSVFIEPVDDLQAEIEKLMKEGCRSVLVIPDASVTVPVPV